MKEVPYIFKEEGKKKNTKTNKQQQQNQTKTGSFSWFEFEKAISWLIVILVYNELYVTS